MKVQNPQPMPDILEGNLTADAKDRYAIVVSRFNEAVTERLLSGAVATLRRHGVAEAHITAVRVPGSFELPLVADRLAASKKFQAVLALGAVIQGETTHHEYINGPMSASLMQSGLRTGVPVLFGVLTCQNMDQAVDRSGGKAGNKGAEAAVAALEMVSLLKQIADVAS